MAKQFKPETLCVQAGWTPKKGEPRVLPIYQSTTFKYDTSEQMARLFDLEDSGYFYTHLQGQRFWRQQRHSLDFAGGYKSNLCLPGRTGGPSARWYRI